MTTSQASIAGAARVRLRDFGQFFEVPYARVAPTLRLPHPLVDANRMTVWQPNGTAVTVGWALDSRNGVMKFETPTDWMTGVGISGYHYEWFLNEDLEYFAGVTINYHTAGRDDISSPSQFTATEADVIAIGTVVQALWSLVTELATDIDVSTPEGMGIPASQRFKQMWQLLQFWMAEYRRIASLLNVGLERIEQFVLRRTALTTNRLVPVYRPRELGDPRWPERIYPKIDPHKQAGDHSTADNELDVYSHSWSGW